MRNYLQLCQQILAEGTRQSNRTGTDAISLPGAMLKFDLAHGFPAVTTKRLAFDSMKGEIIAFLRGYTDAADFAKLGCGWWFDNANKNKAWLDNPNRKGENDLGRVYGAQWRGWYSSLPILADMAENGETPYRYVKEDGTMLGAYGSEIDQVQVALDLIRNDPTNRRIIINAWRPDEFGLMALPPCHVLYQFIVNVEKRELNLCMYQRSCDMFLGVPMNIAGSALLLELFAAATGLTPRHFTHFLADAHIYVNHVDQVMEQASREPYSLPELFIKRDLLGASADELAAIEPSDLALIGYEHHEAIKAPMAV